MRKLTVRDLDMRGKRVLVRVDFNVPLKDGCVADDTRIRSALPTLEYLLAQPAAAVLCSHLGRPDGERIPEYSLQPVANALKSLLCGREVRFASDCVGPVAAQQAADLLPGQVLLLENTRFHPEEQKNDPQFSIQLASLADIFVNDAFGSAHRSHASTEGVAQYMPAVVGLLMEKELDYLGGVLKQPRRPFIVILGGAKISDKIGLISTLLATADRVLVGGGMANTFLKAQGVEVADSLVEDTAIDAARMLLQRSGETFVLPTDVVIADRYAADAASQTISVCDGVPAGWRILDIGPTTVEQFGSYVHDSKMIVWNGPMGVFEFEAFAGGTNSLAHLVAESASISIVGGGDSVAAVRQSGMADSITHISTGGGASLALLEGKTLPGVVALDDSYQRNSNRGLNSRAVG